MSSVHSNKWKEFFFPLKKEKKLYAAISSIVLIFSLMNIAGVEAIRYLSLAIEQNNKQLFLSTVTVLIGIKIFVIFLERCKKKIDWPTLAKTRQHIYDKYIQKKLCMNANQAESIGTGRMISIIQKGYENRGDMHYEVFSVGLKQGCTIIISVVYLFSYSYTALGVGIGTIIAVVIIGSAILRAENDVKKATKETSMDITRLLVRQIMSKFEILQANNIAHEKEKMKVLRQQFINNKLREVPYKRGIQAMVPFIVTIGEIGTYTYIGLQIFAGNLSISDFIVFLSIFALINRMVSGLVSRFRNISRKIPHIEKLRDTFEGGQPIYGYNTGKTFIYKRGDIYLNNITFGYEGQKPLFDKFSLHIPGGKKTAIVGKSGGGKSTLIKLIAGYMAVNKGYITIDNQHLPQNKQKQKQNKQHVSLQSYYKHIGFLTQEPSIFDGTIIENICYGVQQKITPQKIDSIIAQSACEFIYTLPQGLYTHIGERGVRLSGGQRQRLAIAKILLKNPEIIILDEPTSALDSMNEERVTKAMHNLFKNRTVIIIAHRLQTVQQADEIIVMEHGHVCERGSHKKLVQQKGKYAKLLKLQSSL